MSGQKRKCLDLEAKIAIIAHCFRKGGFVKDAHPAPEDAPVPAAVNDTADAVFTGAWTTVMTHLQTTATFDDYASVDANLPTTSALTEDELFTYDTTPTDDATSADENDESDPSPAEQIKNIAECFDRLSNIRQFICNRATQSDDAAGSPFVWCPSQQRTNVNRGLLQSKLTGVILCVLYKKKYSSYRGSVPPQFVF